MIPVVTSFHSLFVFLFEAFITLLATYPIIGGFSWFIGAFCYTFLFKHKQKDWDTIPVEAEPFITIMVPAHNEEIVIAHTIEYLMTKLNYVNYEVLVMDDGSTDHTPQILQLLQKNILISVSSELKKIKEKLMPLILGLVLLREN